MVARQALRKAETIVFYLIILLLPTQLGKHFWPEFSLIQGIRIDYLSPTLYVTDLLIGLLFIIWLIRVVPVYRLKHPTFNRIGMLFGVFFFYLLLNVSLSNNLLNGLHHLLKFLEFSFVGFYCATMITSLRQYYSLVFILALSAIGESLLAFFQFLHQSSLGEPFYFFGERTFTGQTPGIANASIAGELLLRPYGTFSHPNVLAGFLVCVSLLVLFIIPALIGFRRIILACSLLVSTGALLLTMSRVAILTWLLILVFASLRMIRGKWISFVMLSLLILGIILSPVGGRLLQTNTQEESFVQRQELTLATVSMIKNHWVVGVGFGNYLPSLGAMPQMVSLKGYLQPVHNIFLLLVAEIGVVGFSFFLLVLWKTYQRLLQQQKRTHVPALFVGLCVCLSVLLILGLSDHYWITLQQGQLLFAVILGFCWIKFDEK